MADINKNAPPKQSKLHNANDSLFKAFMSNIDNARDFFLMALPDDILAMIDTTTLSLCPESFVDNKLKHKHVDVLYQTTFEGKPGYLYILTEQQTQPDENLPFRIMQYIMRIIAHYQKQHKTKEFPLIYPLIYYVGKQAYPFSTNFFDGFGDNKAIAQSILTNPFQLVNIHGVTEDDLKNHPNAGTLAKIYQIAHTRDVVKELMNLHKQVYYLDVHGHSDFVLSVLEYILKGHIKQL